MAPTILDAVAHPKLFGPWFKGDSYDAWKAYFAALFALPMTAEQLAIYQKHTGRQSPPKKPFRESALIVGRRGGKSMAMATIAVFLATMRDYSASLRPGEKATIGVIAADRVQAGIILGYVKGLLMEVPTLAGMIDEDLKERITLTNNVAISIMTASIRTTRGPSYAAVICDEAAYWRSDDGAANLDEEVLRALRPGMGTIKNSVLILASSPYRRAGSLFNAYKKHYGRDDASTLVWQAATLDMNPALDPAVVAEAMEADPAAARAEYYAEFRDDLADFVDRSVVDACTVPGRHELPRLPGVRYTAFVDPSGGRGDDFVLAISHPGRDDTRVLDLVRAARPPFAPEAVVKEFAQTMKGYGITSVTGDNYAAEWVTDSFRSHGIRYHRSERTASEIFQNALALLNSHKIELLDHGKLHAQICALERRTSPSGRDQISHPKGGHDDIANAALGSLLLVAERKPMKFSQAFLNRIGPPGGAVAARL